MPYNIPLNTPKLKEMATTLGHEIKSKRKKLNITTQAVSESAGISRVTLNRIEKGEGSVAIGAYIKVISVLGLSLKVFNSNDLSPDFHDKSVKESKVSLKQYPQLKKLAWQLKKTKDLTPSEALSLYERNWRHLDLKEMSAEEWRLIQKLISLKSSGRLLV